MNKKLKIKIKDNNEKEGIKDSKIIFSGNIPQRITFNSQFNLNPKTGYNNENKTIIKNENKIVKDNISNDSSNSTTTHKNTPISKQPSIKKNMVVNAQSNIIKINKKEKPISKNEDKTFLKDKKDNENNQKVEQISSDNTTTNKNTSISKQPSIKKNMVEKVHSNIIEIKNKRKRKTNIKK